MTETKARFDTKPKPGESTAQYRERILAEALGAASVSWHTTPSGTFDSEKAKSILDEIIPLLGIRIGTRLNLSRLEKTADSATGAAWEVDKNFPFSNALVGIFDPELEEYIVKFDFDNPPAEANARFIAEFDPATVKELVRIAMQATRNV